MRRRAHKSYYLYLDELPDEGLISKRFRTLVDQHCRLRRRGNRDFGTAASSRFGAGGDLLSGSALNAEEVLHAIGIYRNA
jgi:hypothetical protein